MLQRNYPGNIIRSEQRSAVYYRRVDIVATPKCVSGGLQCCFIGHGTRGERMRTDVMQYKKDEQRHFDRIPLLFITETSQETMCVAAGQRCTTAAPFERAPNAAPPHCCDELGVRVAAPPSSLPAKDALSTSANDVSPFSKMIH